MEVLALERTLTELDHVRLTNLIHRDGRDGRPSSQAHQEVEDILDLAYVLPSRTVAPDIVTMYSQVLLAEPHTGRQYKLTLCYPPDAEPGANFVSVFSPVGSSLLGLRVGSVARWRTPVGEEGSAELLAIVFQPEASGDYTL